MYDTNHFGPWDYFTVGVTLLFPIFIGIYYAFVNKQTNEELLVGGRQMNIFAVSASMLVTYMSAITILGYPAEIYAHGLQIFVMTLLSLFFVPLSTYMFVSVLYKMKLTSVYKYLELRYDTVVVRLLASSTFILQCCVVTSIQLYAPGIAIERILGIPIWMSIVGIGACGAVYTSIGGLRAVVWTDAFQFIMIIVGMFAIVIKGFISAGGVFQAFAVANEHGRLTLLDFTVDPFMRHNTLNFILGSGFSIMCLYGTHQPQVQRYCSLPTFGHAVKAIALSVALKVFTVSLVVFAGVAIFATYANCDPLLLGEINRIDAIVPYFVLTELAFIPGMAGLFISCIFSAVLSSISSALNSLSACTWEDFLSRISFFKNLSEKNQATVTKVTALLYGVLCIGLAFVAQNMGAIFQATLAAVGAFSGPLGGIFLMSLFMPCTNKWGATAGMLTGLVSMIYVSARSFLLEKPPHASLPVNIDNCPAGTNMSNLLIESSNATVIGELEWPDKLFTLSYILYPFVGACITLTVGLIISIVTGGISQAKKLDEKLLHPILKKCSCCCPVARQTFQFPSTYKRADRLSGLYAVNPHLSNPDLIFNSYKYDPLHQHQNYHHHYTQNEVDYMNIEKKYREDF